MHTTPSPAEPVGSFSVIKYLLMCTMNPAVMVPIRLDWSERDTFPGGRDPDPGAEWG